MPTSLRHLRSCAWAPSPSASPAASPAPDAQRSHSHNAAGDKDEPGCRPAVPHPPGCASSGAGSGSRWPALHQQRLARHSACPASCGTPWSSTSFSSKLSTTTSLPSASFAASAERSAPSSFLLGNGSRTSAAAVRGPCRHAATEASGSSPRARGPCPSASTASCPRRYTSFLFLVACVPARCPAR